MSESCAGPLVALSAVSAPLGLNPTYPRHSPKGSEVQDQLRRWLADRDWVNASWLELINGLMAAGRADVPLSRLFEGHVDAVRILDQSGRDPVTSALYGVWASRSQQTGVAATQSSDGLRLDGVIRFASGAGLIDRALVPVWLDSHRHLLVDVDVKDLPVDDTQWATAAMEVSRSHTVGVEGVRVSDQDVVGSTNFYLDRPAFFPGGVGVAACWAGGAARVADLALARMHEPVPEQMRRRLGTIRLHLTSAVSVIRSAARLLDEHLYGRGSAEVDWRAVSTECRAVVAAAVGGVLEEAQRLAGPAGLAYDRDLTRAIHDLQLYVLQQNVDADTLYLGTPDR